MQIKYYISVNFTARDDCFGIQICGYMQFTDQNCETNFSRVTKTTE